MKETSFATDAVRTGLYRPPERNRFALETARLRLRPCRIGDLLSVHALWADERVRHFLFDDRAISLEETRSFIEASLANFEQYGYGLWLVCTRDLDYLAGFAGFLRSGGAAPSLIYGVHPDFWRCGYATEAAAAVLRYGLKKLALPKVRADVDEPNVASVRVLEKLGMTQTGRAEVNGRPLLYFEQSR